ncbi:MAG: T9SS type A sorting domain-containing protein [Ignavibacteria bacterium]|nr:T9SS type A sorting domain-containing protein [Ignavibacteria bacterium]
MRTIIFLSLTFFTSMCFSQTWNVGLQGRVISATAIDKAGYIYTGSTLGAIFRSTNSGVSWDTLYRGPNGNILSICFDTLGIAGNIYAVHYRFGLVKSSNAGLSWSLIDTSFFSGAFPLRAASTKSGIIHVGTNKGYFRSTNNGSSFQRMLPDISIDNLVLDRSNSNFIYIGATSFFGVSQAGGVYRSTDGGVTFSDNLHPNINCDKLYQSNQGDLYKLTSLPDVAENLYKSSDKGLTWIALGSTPASAREVILSPSGNEIFVGCFSGVYKSSNNGTNWTNLNYTYWNTTAIIANNKIFVNTLSSSPWGIHSTDLLTNINDAIAQTLPEYITLYQNYPNPFNPATTIVYELKKAENISLKIYDALGNELKEIDNGFKNAGRYKVNFSGENLSSGVYFARLTVNGNTLTSRLVLLK